MWTTAKTSSKRRRGTTGSYGTFSIDAAGNWSYARTADLQSMNDGDLLTDSFTVTSVDGTDSETVTVTIEGLNDQPSVSGVITATRTEDEDAFTVDLLAGASDPDNSNILTIANLTVTGDTIGITRSSNQLTVAPAAYNALAINQSEVITYRYDIIDGQGGSVAQHATITITGLNDAPQVGGPVLASATEDDNIREVNLLNPASDPDTGDVLSVDPLTLTLVSGDERGVSVGTNLLTVDPAVYNYLAMGQEEVIVYEYDIIDGNGGSVRQTASITVMGVNDAPTAADDTATTTSGTPVDVVVLDNDSDPDGDTLTPVLLTLPSNGTAEVNDDGTVTYTPNEAFVGTDTFTYSVEDGSESSSSATVTITVEPLAENPVFATVSGPDWAVAGQTLAYFAETLGPTDSLSWEVTDTDGILLAMGSGNDFTYMPTETGVQSVQVTATSSSGATATQTLTLNVEAVGVVDGDLYVAGTNGNDVLEIVTDGGGTVQVYRDQQLIGSFGDVTGTVVINGFGGDDVIEVTQQTSLPTLISGGDGNDSITGGSGRDQIDGGAGQDLIYGRNGSDVLIGGEAADIIFGGNGSDWIDGGEGDDLLFGENANDTLIGGQGADEIFGGRGKDLLIGLEEEDVLGDDLGKDLIENGPALALQDDPKKKDKKK